MIVARCSVDYPGRLPARLPEALLVMLRADGSVLVHADAGGLQAAELRWNLYRPETTIGMSRPVDISVRASRAGPIVARLDASPATPSTCHAPPFTRNCKALRTTMTHKPAN